MSECNFSKIGLEILAGAKKPKYAPKEYPGTPDSATVGRSGAADERVTVVIPSARNLPAFIIG